MPADTSQLLDDQGRLEHDAACVGCGYNLRGLLVHGVCTECGRPVLVSLQGSPLEAADPRWVRRLSGAAARLLMLLPWFWLPLSWPLAFHAYWQLAGHPPAAPQSEALHTWLLRLLPIALVAVPWLALLLGIGGALASDAAALIPLNLLTMALFVLLAAYRVLGRGRAPRLRRLCRVALWLWLGSTVLLVLAVLPLLSTTAPAALAPVPAALGALGLATFLAVFLLVLLRLNRLLAVADVRARYGRSLFRARAEAAARQAATTPPPAAGAAPPRPA